MKINRVFIMCLPWQNNNGNTMFCTTEVQLCVKEQFVKPIISVQRCYSNEDWTHIKKEPKTLRYC